jgi:hypothetical protein
MPVESTYKVPYRRLARLSRTVRRKAFKSVWLLQWLVLAAMSAAAFAYFQYGDALNEWLLEKTGTPYAFAVVPLGIFVFYFAALFLVRRFGAGQLKRRVDYDQTIHLTTDDGGIRIGTDRIEYYLKWLGISQMLIEPDGVVVSHGSLFFLVPDAAFANPGERLAFIRDVYGRLSENARAISEKFILPELNAAGWR